MITGTGFRIVSTMLPELAEEAALVAVIVTVLVVGATAGAVYNPVAEMVPVRLDPPNVPFTCQVTEWLVVPETVAANCTVLPARA